VTTLANLTSAASATSDRKFPMAYETRNPYTDEVLKRFPDATDAEVQTAIDHAHRAFMAWKDAPFAARAKVMQNAADILRRERASYPGC
jgi:succinate-semialdehyde dehydrogenase/glutarate-semialdehyde dehydrogenase